MESLEELIRQYKAAYQENDRRQPIQRLPIILSDEKNTSCRLAALFSLEVERRNREFLMDENSREKIDMVARWLVHSTQPGLILMGTMGNGKSTMLRAIRRLFPYYSELGDAQEIFDFFKEHQGGMRFWDEKLLLIDDLGVEPVRCLNYGEESFPLTKLLLHRYDKQLTTIVATNLHFSEIRERYGERIGERMIETYEAIPYNHPSYRLGQ